MTPAATALHAAPPALDWGRVRVRRLALVPPVDDVTYGEVTPADGPGELVTVAAPWDGPESQGDDEGQGESESPEGAPGAAVAVVLLARVMGAITPIRGPGAPRAAENGAAARGGARAAASRLSGSNSRPKTPDQRGPGPDHDHTGSCHVMRDLQPTGVVAS